MDIDSPTGKERQAIVEMCRADFYFFVRWMFLQQYRFKWIKGGHHKKICDKLMDVYNGKTKKLIINISPRAGKSQILTYFAAWCIGHHPDSEFIYVSYTSNLSTKSGYAVRELLKDPAYREVFPYTQLREDGQAKDEWYTTRGGCFFCTGTGGGCTGFGAGKKRDGFGGCIIADDLHKADEAKSKTIRDNVIDWFSNTLITRRNRPDTPIIVVMQRLHEEDIAGHLLTKYDDWEHLCIPAIDELGESFWPEMFPIEDLKKQEEATPFMFAGQFMQNPVPVGGGMIKPEQLQIIDATPTGYIKWWRGWDFGATTNGDWTVGVKFGKLLDGRYIIGDVVRMRAGPHERDAAILNTARLDGYSVKISIPQDPGQAGKTQALYLTRMLEGFSVHVSPESGDKVTRAEPMASQINVGNVLMQRGSWNGYLIDEMKVFPVGKHDDIVDASSRAFSELITTSRMLNITDEMLAII